MPVKNAKPIESAKLCLDKAIELLQDGKDVKSYLYQFCLQMARHLDKEGNEKQAKYFRDKAKILRELPKKD